MPSNDIEQPAPKLHPRNGFAAVADKVARDIDKTTTIYRRFDRLSARNILLLQAELAELEDQQDRYDLEDCRNEADPVVINSRSDYKEFIRNANEKNVHGEDVHPREAKRLQLALNIRAKLKEYHETLAMHKDLLNTTPPAKNTVKAMRNWFLNTSTDSKLPDGSPQLWGASEHIYSDYHDLMALRVPSEQDRLSTFIQNNFSFLFRSTTSSNGTIYISERSISRFVAFLSTILAAVLLFGAIISLYFVKNEYALLGMVAGWTVLFAFCVGVLTNAKREQIFGSTAAYAAVLVVFVSGNLGNPSSAVSPAAGCICQMAPT